MANDENPLLPLGGGDGNDGANGTGGPTGASSIIPINIEDEMRRSYLDYSMSVIIGRALPDVRDGLKPVHRRILYTLHEMGLQYNKKYTKCAKVVGQAMGVFHPHGDSAIYDTMVRLAQPFSLRYPMIDGQGNFGSVDGDPPAAMRYTECRMMRIASEMLADIDMETVDFMPNYDESTFEPTVLPARIPNLIVNGSNGIAVGMATNIPPHNLTEVVNATIEMINNPQAGLIEVLKHVQGPDFPTGGFLYGRGGVAQAYATGRGKFLIRAKVSTENLTKEKQAIIVSEIPYQVNKMKLIERIAELYHEKVIDDITDVRDESDRDGMRIVIELRRGAEAQIVLNQLYKHTQMQESFSMIFLAVVNGQPKELPLHVAIQHFIDHRVDVVRRRTAFLLRKAREREHILEGYKIALDNLDRVIRIIRGSGSRAEARENLRTWSLGTEIVINLDKDTTNLNIAPGMSYRQIDAVLELQLYRLTQLSIDELLKELAQVRENIAEYESILASEKKLRGVIVKELEEVKKQYGDERRTLIVDESAELQLEDLIADEQVAVTVSHSGYLKRTPISTYRQQRRGGTGRIGMKTREEDFVSQLIIDSTHAYLLCFTNTGRVFWLKVYEIPDVGAAGKGKAIASLLNLQPGETVRNILPVRNLEEEGKFVFFATQKGTVKKTPLKDFCNVMARGIIAIGIDADDELIGVRITDGSQVVFLATHEGMAIRFDENDVRSMGRPAYGVRGIDLGKNDYLVGLAVTPKERIANGNGGNTPSLILSVTSNGFGKRTDVDEYRLQTRGGKGVINVKTTARNGKVQSINLVDDTSELMVISQYGKIIRIDTKTVRAAGRSTQGVKLLNLEEDDKVAAAVVIPPEEAKADLEDGTLLQ
ncbi:DNA gyrase subunit A [Acidisarcina polymorpha]|uniref:DNA gyrase subunit A n=1 Tax=Acidisarcina polymorpha TaxID=2211140 RepID=A0A2Z5G6I4_9BACT|nr:DNA gyrase subunit A [Acidisarcina polymorpha]AXC14274.1 DNA gyrase subunit A [Acidisarcina polymorpha]